MFLPCGNKSAHIPSCEGEVCDLTELSVSQNGTYEPSEHDGFSTVVVDVPMPSGSISISQNGTYDVSAFADAVVDVQTGGSDDNFLIAIGAKSGSVFDTEASVVGSHGFYFRNNITGVEMQNCRTIGSSAFWNAIALSSISFPMCEIIHNNAFNGCTIGVVSLPRCLSIGAEAFRMANVGAIDLPMCQYLGMHAFAANQWLSSVSLPACETLNGYVFASCSQRLTVVSLPSCTQMRMGGNFAYCRSLQSVYLPLVSTPIGQYEFESCSALKTIYAPLVTGISASAFRRCVALESVEFPACSYVGYDAFLSCSGLRVVSLPTCNFVEGFTGCTSLMSLYLLSTAVVATDSYAFRSTPIQTSSYTGAFGSIYVPSSLVDAYKAASGWSYYSDRITAYTGE